MKTQIIIILLLMLLCGCSENIPVTGSTEYMILNSKNKSITVRNRLIYLDSLLFTGKLVELYESGDTARISEYESGLLNGHQIVYSTEKKLIEERYYIKGKKEGEHKGWWPSGLQRFVIHYKNDVFEGNFKMWNESGMLFNDFNYSNGHEEGLQKAWFADGNLQANYIAKNNRKYGLTGVKNCRSVKDEINN